MSFRSKLSAIFRSGAADAEMAEEMREHLKRRVEANLGTGMSEEEARYAAQRQFGGVEQLKEIAREQRGWFWLEQLKRDVRYAFRQFAKSMGFTAVVVLTLALGIGASVSIYSAVSTLILNPVGGPEPERLVQLGQHQSFRGQESYAGVTPPVLDAIEAHRDLFTDLGWCDPTRYERPTEDFVALEVGARVSGAFFSLVNARPLLGRILAAGDVVPLGDSIVPAKDAAIVISHAWWQSTFGGDPKVLGRTITMSGCQFLVVGVMPPHFQFPNLETKYWVATEPYRAPPPGVRAAVTQVVARLKPGMGTQPVQAVLDTLAKRLMDDYPAGTGYGGNWRGMNPHGLNLWVRPLAVALQDGRGAEELRGTLFALLAAVGFVLLIVCANVANLTLARVERRWHELGLRAALGAGRGRLMRQLLTENLLLATMGGVGALLVTAWGTKAFTALGNLPQLRPVEMDLRMLGVGLGLSLATGLVFGLAPMWRGSCVPVRAVLSGGPNASGGRQRSRYRDALVMLQVAIAVVLLTGAGLMLRSVMSLLKVDPGFDPENLLMVDVPLPGRKYDPASLSLGTNLKNALYAQLSERFAALPGVKAVGVIHSYGGGQSVTVEGRADRVDVSLIGCGVEEQDVFRAMRIPLLAGRAFNRGDVERKNTVVINDAMARLCWPGESAVGKTFGDPKREVIGVVADVRASSYTEVVPPAFYRPYQDGSGMRIIGGTPPRFVLRTTGDPRDLIAAVRRELKAAESGLAMPSFRIARQVLYDSTLAQRAYRNYLIIFAGVGLLLAALGIYGVLAYSVACRTREIGIRIAVGADRRAVLGLIMGEGGKLIGTGIVVGLAAAVGLTRFIRSQLFNVSPNDPLVLAGVVMVLAAVALVACWLPARRATLVDPMAALRAE